MSTPQPHGGSSKYAWSEIPGRDLPKRDKEQRLADFHETHFPFDEETARDQASRCIQCPHPGCVMSCPMGSPIQEWLQLTADGRFLDAAARLRLSTPIAEICARLCPRDHLCEDACVVNGPAETVSIGAIEEFLAEYAIAHGAEDAAPSASNGFRVAVVGSGPAGLAGADELSRRGFAVEVFDRASRPGGLLLEGTSTLRIEEVIVGRRVEILRRRGVNFHLGVRPGDDLRLSDLRGRFDAVFVAPDARRARGLDIPGASLPGIVQGVDFVAHSEGEAPSAAAMGDFSGRRLVVVGEDDNALDCVRTALRLRVSEAVCACPHPSGGLPCCRREYDDATEEGARFLFEVVPVAILPGANGRVAGIRLARVAAGPAGSAGGGTVPGTEHELPADWIVLALGADTDGGWLTGDFRELADERGDRIPVDARQMTRVPGVFAGGDLVRGPSEVVIAVRDAREAVTGIEAYLADRRDRAG